MADTSIVSHQIPILIFASVASEEFVCKLNEKQAGVEGVEIPRDDLLEVGYGDN